MNNNLEAHVTIVKLDDDKYSVWLHSADDDCLPWDTNESFILGQFSSFDAANEALLLVKGIVFKGGIRVWLDKRRNEMR